MNFLKFLFSFLLSINTIYCINLPSNDEGNFNEEHETELTKRSRWDNDFNLKIFDDMRKDLENNPIYDDMRREMEENPIYDEMRKNIEINPIYDDMRREMENKQKKQKLPQKNKVFQLYCLVISVALRRMEYTCVNVIIVAVNMDIVVNPVHTVILDASQDTVNVGNY